MKSDGGVTLATGLDPSGLVTKSSQSSSCAGAICQRRRRWGVRVLRADDGRPELVGSGVESDDAEPGVQRAGGSGEEHERGVVDGAGRLIPDVRRTM
jgi:hypothetical protein